MKTSSSRGLALGLALAFVALPAIPSQAADDAPLFERDIRPILQAHCVKCHAHTDPEAGLDLSTAGSLLKGSDDGPIVIAGSAEQSSLVQKIASGEMPPSKENNPLSDAQIALVRAWIAGGTRATDAETSSPVAPGSQVTDEDRTFWAFRTPIAPPVPTVKAHDRVRSPIDAFLLARQETKGLAFSKDAHRLTLLRRAYLDLLGLPPQPDEIEAFLADASADAYERLIDRLLDSPHYGERWGRHWLDVAGYTDSPHCDVNGKFLPVDDWRYRDYVVSSFNDDKPYDRFLTEQLAGDELVDWASASKYTPEILEALIATGYLRTTPDWTHGDQTQAYRYRYDTVGRVVENVSTGLLGLTMGCARCHSHKFDPIPQQDYYRMLAVFATAYNLDDWKRPEQRFLPDISQSDQQELAAHNARLDERVAELREQLEQLERAERERLFAERLSVDGVMT